MPSTASGRSALQGRFHLGELTFLVFETSEKLGPTQLPTTSFDAEEICRDCSVLLLSDVAYTILQLRCASQKAEDVGNCDLRQVRQL